METAQTLEELLMNYEPTQQEYAVVYARKSTQANNSSIEAQTSLAMDVIKKKVFSFIKFIPILKLLLNMNQYTE